MGHALTDYAFQTPWIAQAKNRHAGPPPSYNKDLHGPVQPVWIPVLTAHALISGIPAAIITGDPLLAFWVVWTHWLIDYFKCEKYYNIWVDQFLHVAVLMAVAVVSNLL